jgi:MFS family permease
LIIGIGGIIGTISVGYMTDYVDRFIAIKIYICILGLALLLLANGFVLSLVFASALILGFSSSAFSTSTSSYLQILVDDEFRGRVMSIYQIGFGLSSFGGLLIGVIAELVGVKIAIDVFAILIIGFLLFFHVFGNRSKMNLIDLID